MLTFKQDNIGEFQEKEFGHFFTYRNTSDEWALSNGLIHLLCRRKPNDL